MTLHFIHVSLLDSVVEVTGDRNQFQLGLMFDHVWLDWL